jgi:hypothetical protein
MTRILAIAVLQVRAAVRSKLFVCLMAILALTVTGLPLTVRGDGTLIGQMRVILYYTLGLTTVILAAATLWASSGAISQEIATRQLQLVMVKPVRHFEVWFGKWIGMLAMNTVLLFLSGALIWLFVAWKVRTAPEQERRMVLEEILTGRHLIKPVDSIDEQMRSRFERLVSEKRLPPDVSEKQVLSMIRRQLMAEQVVVAPGNTKRWFFSMPSAGERTDSEVILKIRFSGVRFGSSSVTGRWTIGTVKDPVLTRVESRRDLDGTYQLLIPVSNTVLRAVGEMPGRTMVVEYTNGDRQASRTVVFDSERGIEVFIRESGFGMNLFRALVVVLCRLALLAAVGLTAGTLFSFAVANFTAFSVLFVALITHYFAFLLVTEDTARFGQELPVKYSLVSISRLASEKLARGLDVVFEPVMRADAVEPVSEGVLVPWSTVGEAALVMVLLYPGVLGLFGVLLFRRRELALPAS